MNAKRATIEALLASDQPIVLKVDGRSCHTPVGADDHALVLRMGAGLTPPAWPTLGEDTLDVPLSFSGVSQLVRIPWDAIYVAQIDGDPWSLVFWPKSAPAEGIPPIAPRAAPPVTRAGLRSV